MFEKSTSVVIADSRKCVAASTESNVDWQCTLDPDPTTLDPLTPDPPHAPHTSQPSPTKAEPGDAKKLIKKALDSRGLHTIEDIENIITLYLMDIGGQPELHEIMPIILNGPALHVVLFNLAFNLDEPIPVDFRHKDSSDALITYMSSYTAKQMIFQLLSSIYYVSKGSSQSESAAVLIGTHLDQLINQEGQVQEINDSLKQLLNNMELHDRGFLAYPKTDEKSPVFIPVNNYSGNEKEIQQLQVFLKQIIDDRFGPVELPSSWLLFHLLLRHRYETSPGVCTLAECRALAEGCGLDEDDVPQVLRYIHRHLGTVLFYEEVQGLNELVICDLNVLFKSIYHLIAVSFAGDRVYHTAAANVRKTGELPGELVKRICAQPSSSLLTNEHILGLLKHFKILIELPNGACFMPCLLQPDHSLELSRDVLLSLRIPPLLVRFDGNYIPIGVFSALVVKLSQTSWEPDPDVRYRNHISFLTDGLSSVELMIYPSYLEFRIPIDKHKEPEEIHQFCVEVRQKVVNTLKAVLNLHEHTRKVGFQLGFYCPVSFQADQPHFGGCLPRRNHTDPPNLLCSKSPRCQGQCRLPHKCTTWFDYWKVSNFLDVSLLHASYIVM